MCGYSHQGDQQPKLGHVYQYTDLSNGSHRVTCGRENCTLSGTEAHTFVSGVCEYCNAKQPFTVNFYDYNGAPVGDPQTVLYGEDAVPPTAPTREGYDFMGWSGDLTNITRNRNFVAQYRPQAIDPGTGTQDPDAVYHTVRFFSEGELLYTDTVLDGGTAVFTTAPSAQPTKEGYTFKDWDKSLVNVTADLDVNALFVLNNGSQVIATFVNYDNTFLANYIVNVGDNAADAYTAATPAKPDDATYSYVFSGWNPDTANIAGDQVFTAQFDAVPLHVHEYNIWDSDETQHWKKCSCGAIDEATRANHDYATKVSTVTTATCKTEGVDKMACACGAEANVNIGFDATNHEGGTETRNAVTATCKTAGYTGDTWCLGCNTKIADGTSTGLDENNHEGTTELQGYRAPTETEDGYSGDTVYACCGKIVETGHVLEKTGTGSGTGTGDGTGTGTGTGTGDGTGTGTGDGTGTGTGDGTGTGTGTGDGTGTGTGDGTGTGTGTGTGDGTGTGEGSVLSGFTSLWKIIVKFFKDLLTSLGFIASCGS